MTCEEAWKTWGNGTSVLEEMKDLGAHV